MVARNFPIQEIPYSQLMQIPEDDPDFITLEELKPGIIHQDLQQQQQYQASYYELSSISDNPCSSSTISYQTDTDSNLKSPSVESTQTVDSTNSLKNTKRKHSHHETSDLDEDNGDESTKSVKTSDENKKQNHSEIEKRRRDKMNTLIVELSHMVPMCNITSKKLDKLTVLRMAVEYMKIIKGANVHSYTEGHYKPSFLSDQELKQIILQIADGFLFVVGCDDGRFHYVSQSVSNILNFSQNELVGQTLFDILHPKDIAKIKEQLSSSDLNARGRLMDAKTMKQVKTDIPQAITRLCPGARRSFYCRMKYNKVFDNKMKEEADTTTGHHRQTNQHNLDKKYLVIHCTGYLKSCPPTKTSLESETDSKSCNLSCLTAVGRILPDPATILARSNTQNRPNVRPIQFISRHAIDGVFLFVDQRATLILGFLPQELTGTYVYEYCHPDERSVVAKCLDYVLQNGENVVTSKVYRFRRKDGEFIRLRSEWKAFRNPWTDEIEYIISKNNLVLTEFNTVQSTVSTNSLQENFPVNHKNIISTNKIRKQIPNNQPMGSQKQETDLSSESSALTDISTPVPSIESEIMPYIQTDQSKTKEIAQDYAKQEQQEQETESEQKQIVQQDMIYNNVRDDAPFSSDPGGNLDQGIIEIMENSGTEAPNITQATYSNYDESFLMSFFETEAMDFASLS